MAKNSVRDYSATNSDNTDIQSIDISEGCSPAGINNAIREVMVDLKNVSTGAVALESPAFDSASLTGDLTFGDNDKAIFGAGSDLQIYHDGSNSIIDDSGTGNLYIRSNDILLDKYTGERMIRAIADGAVTLYHDNAAKLATTATGVDVTGNLTASGIITASAQPAFRAYSSGSWTIATSTQTIFPANVAVFNVGSGYNTGTYKFTAPVDGVYYFAGQFFASVGSFRAVASLYKNDIQNQDNMGSQSLHLGSTANGGISYATHGLMQLDAGDTVSFYTYQETGSTVTANQSSNLSFWYGYLLG